MTFIVSRDCADRSDMEIAPAVWRILAQSFGEAIDLLRFEDPLDALDNSQWWVLIGVVHSWTRGERSPSQAELARLSALSTRTVRRSLVRLEALGLLRGASESGSTTELGVGPRLAPILRDFASCRDPKIWCRTPRPATSTPATVPPPPADPPDTVAARTADLPPLIKNKKDLSSSSLEGDVTPATEATGSVVDAATLRRLALDALAARFVRANPGIPLPRTCDAGDVKLVEACTAKGTWDAETLRQTHMDAIDGAFDKAAPDRPPTPMYIWGQLRFFLENARIGRAKRLRTAAPPRLRRERPPDDPPASPEWVEQHMRQALAHLETLPDVTRSLPRRRFLPDADNSPSLPSLRFTPSPEQLHE